jgi:hypothetical protein
MSGGAGIDSGEAQIANIVDYMMRLDTSSPEVRKVTKDSAHGLQRTCAESTAGLFSLLFVRSQFGEGSRRDGGKRGAD